MKKTIETKINGVVIRATAETIGQESPNDGNMVVVYGCLSLPASGMIIDKSINFITVERLLGYSYNATWGNTASGSRREMTIESRRPTWAEAWGVVWSKLNEAIATLQKAQSEREIALINAGNPEELS